MEKINKTLLNKAKKSYYSKDKVFIKLCKVLDNKNILYTDEDNKARSRITFCTPFVEPEKTLINWRHVVLKPFLNGCMQMLPILHFSLKQQLNQNTVFLLSIFLHLKSILIP